MTTLRDLLNDFAESIIQATEADLTDEQLDYIHDIKEQYIEEIKERIIG